MAEAMLAGADFMSDLDHFRADGAGARLRAASTACLDHLRVPGPTLRRRGALGPGRLVPGHGGQLVCRALPRPESGALGRAPDHRPGPDGCRGLRDEEGRRGLEPRRGTGGPAAPGGVGRGRGGARRRSRLGHERSAYPGPCAHRTGRRRASRRPPAPHRPGRVASSPPRWPRRPSGRGQTSRSRPSATRPPGGPNGTSRSRRGSRLGGWRPRWPSATTAPAGGPREPVVCSGG